jgi:hypothetical protein
MSDGMVIRRVVGTGNPIDALFLIPLIRQWGASRACTTEQEEPCDAPIGRIVILEPPGLADDAEHTSDTLAYCEPHYLSLMARAKAKP